MKVQRIILPNERFTVQGCPPGYVVTWKLLLFTLLEPPLFSSSEALDYLIIAPNKLHLFEHHFYLRSILSGRVLRVTAFHCYV
jgi:hypothetical protein